MDFGGTARQQHGLNFEGWIKSTFFQGFTQTGNTDKWDATGITYKNQYALHTLAFGGLPVSMKTCAYRSSINFGDALRQIENNEDFLLIVGFWQNSGRHKKIVAIGAVKIAAEEWQNLFVTEAEAETDSYEEFLESRTIEKIRELHHGIKREFEPRHTEARKFAKRIKKDLPKLQMTINPKIDSKKQRRVQCSLPFSVFEEKFGLQFHFQPSKAMFWGEEVPLLD
jgi:hypothetical protein